MESDKTKLNNPFGRDLSLFEKLGVGCQLEKARHTVSSLIKQDVGHQAFYRWRKELKLVKGRGAFYASDEISMLAKFGLLVKGGADLDVAYRILADLQAQGELDET